jgi:hypothetical protein
VNDTNDNSARTNASIPHWKDRARWWGLPIIFEWYEIVHEKLVIKRGVLLQQEELLPLYRIVDVKMERSLLDLIFNTGRILLFSVDAVEPILTLRGIKNPRETAELLLDCAEQLKAALGVRGSELFGASLAESDIRNRHRL